jgi:hypothetical protein
MKGGAGWGWALAGKHPVVKDYIRIGQGSPLMDDFSRWVEEGISQGEAGGRPHSWRFFARDAGRASCRADSSATAATEREGRSPCSSWAGSSRGMGGRLGASPLLP